MFIFDFYSTAYETRRIVRAVKAGKLAVPDDEYAILCSRNSAFSILLRYVKHGEWARTASREKLMFFLTNGRAAACKKYGTSSECLNVFISRANSRLKKALYVPYEFICNGDIERGLSYFYSANNQMLIETEFNLKIADMFPKPELDERLRWNDCLDEADLLRELMISSIKKRISSANKKRLSHLVFLLGAANAEWQEEKRELVDYLLGADK